MMICVDVMMCRFPEGADQACGSVQPDHISPPGDWVTILLIVSDQPILDTRLLVVVNGMKLCDGKCWVTDITVQGTVCTVSKMQQVMLE